MDQLFEDEARLVKEINVLEEKCNSEDNIPFVAPIDKKTYKLNSYQVFIVI